METKKQRFDRRVKELTRWGCSPYEARIRAEGEELESTRILSKKELEQKELDAHQSRMELKYRTQ